MSGHRTFSVLRGEVLERPGAGERLGRARAQTLEETQLFELRHAEAVSQVELAGRLEITQSAVSKVEHADDVRVSTRAREANRFDGTSQGSCADHGRASSGAGAEWVLGATAFGGGPSA